MSSSMILFLIYHRAACAPVLYVECFCNAEWDQRVIVTRSDGSKYKKLERRSERRFITPYKVSETA